MLEISYIRLFKESSALFFKVLKEYCVLILAIGAVQSVYKLILHYFIQGAMDSPIYLILYNIILKPFFLVILIAVIAQFFSGKKSYAFQEIYLGLKRCYVRFVLFYSAISICLFFIGYNSSILLYMLIFLKLPFVEASIYFEDTSTLSAIKSSHEKTQGKLLRYMMILLFTFLSVRILGVRFFENFWNEIGANSIGSYINNFLFTTFVLLGHSYFVCLYWVISKNKSYEHVGADEGI